MASSVRISRRAAQFIHDLLGDPGILGPQAKQARTELEIALRTPAEKRIVPQRNSKGLKRAETQSIRAAVMARAGAKCELCRATPHDPLEMHHAFGRVKVKQSERNTMILCRGCHRHLTLNHPSAAYWQEKQAQHFEHHGYFEEAALMRRKIEARELVDQAWAVGR